MNGVCSLVHTAWMVTNALVTPPCARSTAGKTARPPSDEIAERLSQQTTARVKESRKLLAASKRTLKRTKG
jgi:hypothetical protein